MLLDAGVLFLLRWALDDASEAVVAVAVQGLAAALIIPSDKVAIVRVEFLKCGSQCFDCQLLVFQQ